MPAKQIYAQLPLRQRRVRSKQRWDEYGAKPSKTMISGSKDANDFIALGASARLDWARKASVVSPPAMPRYL